MNQSILTKLEQLSMRLEEINAMLSDQYIAADQNKFRELSIEHSQLSPINDKYIKYLSVIGDIDAAEILLKENDDDIKEMAEEEITSGRKILEQLELDLKKSLLPKTLTTLVILLLKFVLGQVVMRRVFFRVTSIECILDM